MYESVRDHARLQRKLGSPRLAAQEGLLKAGTFPAPPISSLTLGVSLAFQIFPWMMNAWILLDLGPRVASCLPSLGLNPPT